METKYGLAVLGALFASLHVTLALGSVAVISECDFPIYFAAVGGSSNPQMEELQGYYTQPYSEEGVGISVKLSPDNTTSGPISQFEYTWANGKISYDLSNINGYPFSSGGMQIVPSMQNDPANPTCVIVDCPEGQSVCTAAYNAPDDIRTMVCDQESNLVASSAVAQSPPGATFTIAGQIDGLAKGMKRYERF
ncbi:uncharacterized protein PV07_12725 [Cladophialophora immunda]|uniref:Antigenic thaumatin-like protein n=1 Tax=Cladophialophora immunda TaxID=569365 RepID=A0A0D2BTV1_9EURO|nr:uncharacterized protein PV07_12725 [Cladophialophora immunda]KIW21855.1 hypothetical protein PV07_12725 [Cladophialophora immunda]